MKQFDPSKHKKLLLGIFTLVILLFGIGWSQDPTNPLFHSQPQPNPGGGNPDPGTLIWSDTCAACNNNLPGWDVFSGNNGGKVVEKTNCIGTTPCIDMGSDTTKTSVAVTNSSIGDISITSGKELEIVVTMQLTANPPTTGKFWGFYLTTNKTLPQTNNYNPADDQNVVFLSRFSADTTTSSTLDHNIYFLRTIGQGDTIHTEDAGCDAKGSVYTCDTAVSTTYTQRIQNDNIFNFTAVTTARGCAVGFTFGPGCNVISLNVNNQANQYYTFSQTFPWLQLVTQQYYLGFYVATGLSSEVYFVFQANVACGNGSNNNMCVQYATPFPAQVVSPAIDTGGFFGPIIKALVNIGVWILNAILGFIAFIAPALQTALTFLEGIMVSAMNFLGNAFGLGNVGTSLATLINQLITFFASGSFASIFTNLPTIFARLLDSLTVYFPWLPNAIAIGLNLASFLVNGVGFTLTVFADATLIGIGVAVTILIVLFFVYTGDNSLGGVLEFWETTEWLILGIGLKFLAYLVNFVLDVVTALIGVIPKPFVQMVAHQLPRIPIVDVSARFVQPNGLMSEIQNGNLFAVALWISGLLFTDLFESASPALPGSIGALVPAAAPALVALKGLTSLLALMTVFAWMAAIFVVPIGWFSNAMDLGVNLPFESSLGNRPSSHLGIRVRKGEKHNVKASFSQLRNVLRRPKKPEESQPDENIN